MLALIKKVRSQCLVVCKLAPSGVAAHLTGGMTIHNSFCLDLDYNSYLENGTFLGSEKQMYFVINEFLCLTSFSCVLWREGLCRKFAKCGSSRHPWGGYIIVR